MTASAHPSRHALHAILALIGIAILDGCAAPHAARDPLNSALERYRAKHADSLMAGAARERDSRDGTARGGTEDRRERALMLGNLDGSDGPPESQPAGPPAVTGGPPAGYWRKDLWHQMGYEAQNLGKRDFWLGFKHSFWDIENALVLTGAMGVSVAIRETGVDGTIRNRVDGHRQLGDMDETIQILGNPGTHFATAGALWLTSSLLKDVRSHEFSRDLAQALMVNGLATTVLKVSANTRAPDGESLAWPSGHTSSAFTAAAVINEHYGPLAGIPSLALAGLVGYQRLDSQVHDFSDVVFGGFLGYVVGTSIARENKAALPEVFGMKVVPFTDPETGASGLALWKQY